MTNSSEIEARIKAQRELLGLTREEFAEKLREDFYPQLSFLI